MRLNIREPVIHETSLTQYDYGQSITLMGMDIPDDTEVHFCHDGMADTVLTSHGCVKIPDRLLCCAGRITAYLYITDDRSGKTVRTVMIHVRAREKPGDYVEPDEPAYSRLIPKGGEAGDMLARTETGYTWKDPYSASVNEATDMDVINMLENILGK